jgi:RHS repeat-associated protein
LNGNGCTTPNGSRERFEYVNGLLTASTDPLGNRYTYEYDEQLNLRQATAPDGFAQTWLFNKLGNCIKYTSATGASQWMEYDLKNRITRLNEPDGNERQIEYDALDNITLLKSREAESRFEYTQISNLAARHEGGHTVKFEYNTSGHLTGITNQKGLSYRFELDAEGLVTAETAFDGKTNRYTRDAAGNIIETRLPGGNTVQYQYDLMNRLTQVQYTGGERLSYTYNRSGQLLTATSPVAELSFEYDELGRKIKETQNGVAVTALYDAAGNRTQVNSTLGAAIRNTYNNMHNITGRVSGNWNCQMQYDAMGRELKRILPAGLQNQWNYDNGGNPVQQQIQQQGNSQRTRRYQWQPGQRLQQVADSVHGLSTFEYDVLGNLTGAVHEKGGRQYRPADAANNFHHQPEMTDTFGDNGQLLETEGFSCTYDEYGNLAQKLYRNGEKWSYRWYASGMLKEVEKPTGETVYFEYDALQRRILKQAGNKKTKWVWDGDVPLHEITQTVFDGSNHEELLTWIFDENSHVPAARLQNGKAASVITSHLGTPIEMYDENGTLEWAAETGIWGEMRSFEGQAAACPFRFQGQYADEETGLYYNRFRYYDPESGQYISKDPIGLQGGIQLYGYVHNTNAWVDPFGLGGFLFRGDNSYKGGDVGLPLGSKADILTPWEHVRRRSNGESSIFTSFTEKKGIAEKFGKTSKVSLADLKALEADGKIKIHTPESVAEMMKKSGNKKLIKDANNVKDIMLKNKEFLIEGTIDKTHIKGCS